MATMSFGQAPGPQIPCVAVGYSGYSTIQSLSQRLKSTPQAERPDAALVIESGCFCGFDISTTGPLGLYALCLAINSFLVGLTCAAPNLLAYVSTDKDNLSQDSDFSTERNP